MPPIRKMLPTLHPRLPCPANEHDLLFQPSPPPLAVLRSTTAGQALPSPDPATDHLRQPSQTHRSADRSLFFDGYAPKRGDIVCPSPSDISQRTLVSELPGRRPDRSRHTEQYRDSSDAAKSSPRPAAFPPST